MMKVGSKDSIWNKDHKKDGCQNCIDPVTAGQLKRIFTKTDMGVLETVASIYTKYMKELNMDTCWNKAHFFAQAVVESGLNMKLKNGESFNWYYQDLIDTFGKFQTEEGREKAKKWGRKIKNRKDPKAVDVTLENEINIANWAYMPDYKTGKSLGNKGGNDGWDFRGRGLLQLTGRGGYEYANTYTLKLGSDIINYPELAGTDISTAVLSSMAFWRWKGLNKISNGTTDVIGKICPQVGNNVKMKDKNGDDSSNYAEKQDVFKNITTKNFLIDVCKWGKENTASGQWHEPVDNPISTLYMQSGGSGKLGEHWGLFGNTRNGSVHQGLDLFAEPGSNVYSCVEGEVFEVKTHSGYGKTVTIKITDKEAFYNHRRDYKILYSSEGEIIQGLHFDKTKDIFLFYAHLRKVFVTKGQKVETGKIIASSGVSGVESGTCAPHLHFEIFTTVYAVGKGLNYRCNPGFYVHFKRASEQSVQERSLQKEISEKGKIEEVNGKD
ncbi:peptidoglycan DD-metalloendopeptidase family protein [Flavobacterium ginsengiterrae]|uniref:M23ase beta-sheet core domain-containing protein n=1 Tax=Flavobacterium ginsengiterrae TaxID=871695 RepID=A0ABP7GV46_9FLAO